MKGHEHIIALRKAGKAPKIVFLNDFPCETDWFENDDHATVCVFGDVVQLLDLRYLVGLKVSITGASETRSKAFFEKVKAVGASVVVSGSPRDLSSQAPRWTGYWSKEHGDKSGYHP